MTFALIYHDIATHGQASGFSGPAAARYKLDPTRFDEHLDAIAAATTHVDLVGTGAPAALTFDDGGASAPKIAELLESRGWRGHFFITTSRIGTRGFVKPRDIVELVERGHDVGSHSHSHPTYMGTLTDLEIADEWRRSRDIIGAIVGTTPLSAAVPGGFVSAEVVAQAQEAGYRLLMTSLPTSRVTWRGGMEVRGRYTIWASTSPTRAAAYARGDRLSRAGLWLAWQAKSGPKHLSPHAYELVRQRWAALRHMG